MAENPLKKSDRVLQSKNEQGDVKQSITLYDVDYDIMKYMEYFVLPQIEINGKSIKIPVVYGNSERWEGARRNGVYRDIHGKIQLPIMMLKRTSVAKNEQMAMPNRHLSYQGVTRWSKNNRYDRFNVLTNQKPHYEVYNITMPDYVEITYSCMGWTNYIENLNQIVESLTWASDEYWGDKTKFKFITSISDYDIINEVNEGAERINRVEFSLNVKAYLLPEQFDGENTTKKQNTLKRIIVSTETETTNNQRIEDQTNGVRGTTSSLEFLALNNSIDKYPLVNDTITFSNINLVKVPYILAATVDRTLTIDDTFYDVLVYKNGIKLTQNTNFTATYSTTTSILTLNFTAGTVFTSDKITITGKFTNL